MRNDRGTGVTVPDRMWTQSVSSELKADSMRNGSAPKAEQTPRKETVQGKGCPDTPAPPGMSANPPAQAPPETWNPEDAPRLRARHRATTVGAR